MVREELIKITKDFLSKSQCSNTIRSLLNTYILNLDKQFTKISVPENKVYANNFVDLGAIKYVGFDLDYTLVSYTDELETMIYNLARDTLVDVYGFPKSLKDQKFEKNFAIRGLTVDTRHGVLCKLSHLQKVGVRFATKGKRPLSRFEIQSLYGDSRHIPYADLNLLRPLNDFFSLAEGCLIADALEHFEAHQKTQSGEPYVVANVIDDVMAAVTDVHLSGAMHNRVTADLIRYVRPSPGLPALLHSLLQGGKKLFLLTNSGFPYAHKTLSHILGPETQDWLPLFDAILCTAHKPDFFFKRRPFRRWDVSASRSSASTVSRIEGGAEGGVYVNGSVDVLMRAKKWKGHEVLYLGDNLKADLVEAKRVHGWTTGCVLKELEGEVAVQGSEAFQQLHHLRSCTRRLMTDLQEASFREGREGMGMEMKHMLDLSLSLTKDSPSVSVDPHRQLVLSLESLLQSINGEMSRCFHPQFGSIFRTDGHPSLFAFSIRRYADLYMTDLTSLSSYSPSHLFYPSQAVHMPHDH